MLFFLVFCLDWIANSESYRSDSLQGFINKSFAAYPSPYVKVVFTNATVRDILEWYVYTGIFDLLWIFQTVSPFRARYIKRSMVRCLPRGNHFAEFAGECWLACFIVWDFCLTQPMSCKPYVSEFVLSIFEFWSQHQNRWCTSAKLH